MAARGAVQSRRVHEPARVVAMTGSRVVTGLACVLALGAACASSRAESMGLSVPRSGSVVAWGCRPQAKGLGAFDQCLVPASARHGVVAVAAGLDQSLALKTDGGVIAWGCKGAGITGGECRIPAFARSGVRAIAAGDLVDVALKRDGSVVAWGCNFATRFQCSVPRSAKRGVAGI